MKYLLLLLCINIYAGLPDTIDTDKWWCCPPYQKAHRREAAYFYLTQLVEIYRVEFAVFESSYFEASIMVPVEDITIEIYKDIELWYCVKKIVKIAETAMPTYDGFGAKIAIYKVIKRR